jgi:hypothetical protein
MSYFLPDHFARWFLLLQPPVIPLLRSPAILLLQPPVILLLQSPAILLFQPPAILLLQPLAQKHQEVLF